MKTILETINESKKKIKETNYSISAGYFLNGLEACEPANVKIYEYIEEFFNKVFNDMKSRNLECEDELITSIKKYFDKK